jgi:hypothetical protein
MPNHTPESDSLEQASVRRTWRSIDRQTLTSLDGMELPSFCERGLCMGRVQKVRAAAALLVKRHGQQAPEVARHWSRDLTERKDPEAAAVCLEIAEAASELLAKGTKGVRESTLTHILSGAVTGAMMGADHVQRRDVERLMKKAKRRPK